MSELISKNRIPNWEMQKDNLKIRFPELTKRDLNFNESKKYEMLSNLQLKLGQTPNELEVIALA